jgi:hypothetical protein
MDKVTGHGNQVWLELNEQAQSQIACRSCDMQVAIEDQPGLVVRIAATGEGQI